MPSFVNREFWRDTQWKKGIFFPDASVLHSIVCWVSAASSAPGFCRAHIFSPCSCSSHGTSSTQFLHRCGGVSGYRILHPSRLHRHLTPAVHSGQEHLLWPTAFFGTLEHLWQDTSQWIAFLAIIEEKFPATCAGAAPQQFFCYQWPWLLQQGLGPSRCSEGCRGWDARLCHTLRGHESALHLPLLYPQSSL